MDLGLNIAASGMLAEQVHEDELANDLANASTPGYKPESSVQQSFGEMLLHDTANGQTVGTIDTGVEVSKGVTDLAQGPIETTDQPLDFAIAGSGFFAVRTAAGVEYTRDGQFNENAAGRLVDQFGNEVLSANGQAIPVGADGTVPSAKIGVFQVAKPDQLGNDDFSGTATGQATGTVSADELEQSGIQPVEAMVNMEAALSAYTAGQQSIATISTTMADSATDVASISS
jgi:flagellar basal-body rod protein FlgG